LSFRSLNDRLLRLEQRQLPRSGASFWECLAGIADPDDLDEEGRELLEFIAKSMPDEVSDEIEAEIRPDRGENGRVNAASDASPAATPARPGQAAGAGEDQGRVITFPYAWTYLAPARHARAATASRP
jgi:hypothetical protein